MTEKTIEILKSLKLGEKYPAHKPIGKQEIEEQSVLSKLHNLEILKRVKYSYSLGNVKYLSKFIELQDFEELVEYMENPNESENGIKGTLEYKILKYLQKNENGKPLNIEHLSENKDLLNHKVSELSKSKKIQLVNNVHLAGTEFKNNGIRCMIKDLGIEWLFKVESLRTENVNHNYNYVGQINQAESLNLKKTYINQPKTDEKKQNVIISFIKKFWWQILIPLVIGILLILIEKGKIDIGI